MTKINLNQIQWRNPALAIGGLVFIARAVIGLYAPDYWSPHTPLDYAAVVGTSLALSFLAFGIWGFYLQNPASPSRAQTVWRVGVLATCVSALTVGLSNFIDDALNVKGLGYVWAFGILTLTAGLLVVGVSAFWVQGFSRWVGVLFIVCALGLLFTESNGWFGLGLALLALSALKGTQL